MKKLIFFAILGLFLFSCEKKDFSPFECIDPSKICVDCPVFLVYDPVCGCDGKTYGNTGEAENAGVKSWTKGACNQPDTTCIDSSRITKKLCPTIYDPVCGCDGKTYTNACEAEAAGVKSWTKGACNQPDTTCIDSSRITKKLCPTIYDPVCGCDGKTYNNECEAQKAGVKSWTKGPCDKPDTACIDSSLICDICLWICPDIYDPVCGCDGKTYKNECEAKIMNGVKSWTKGACNQQDTTCIDPSKIRTDVFCPTLYDPVCGCDGKTYGNACEAEAAGLKFWYPEPCVEIY